ncbi:MAG: right-handed parallel beta-helix repeat-containing protein [Bacteroidota bacterium]
MNKLINRYVHLFAWVGLLLLFSFASNAQSITVTAPNGGEDLNVFSKKVITWTTTGLANGTVLQVHYSVDNGTNWTIIGESPVQILGGSLTWYVPDEISATCKIRVKSKLGAETDESNTAFSISYAPKQIVVHYPNGGETMANGTQTISWGAGNGITDVNIYIPGSKGAITSLGTNVPNTGSFTFNFANASQLTNNVVVIEEAGNTANKDQSNFEVNTAYGGGLMSFELGCCKFFQVGAERPFPFTKRFIYKANFYYSNNGGSTWMPIILNHPTDVIYSWKIPNDISSTVSVKVENAVNAAQVQINGNSAITTTPASITLTSPKGGESWTAGSQQAITWTSNSIFSGLGFLEYSANNGTSWTMISGAGQQSPYTWTVPATPATTYKVRIRDPYDFNYTNASVESPSFTVAAANPTITLTSPNGSESYQTGAMANITWASTDVSQVNVELSSDNGTTWSLLASNINALLGTYAATIPATVSANCLIKITDSSNSSVSDMSNASFAIKSLALTSPNGGESWAAGSTQNITWTSNGISSVFLHYTTDNGTTWTAIGSTLPATPATYAWTVPATASTNYKIRVSDRSNGNILDISDASFTVTSNAAAITLTSPNGGQSWAGGTAQTITWTTTGLPTTAYLQIEYTTNNENWFPLATVQNTVTSRSWTVPANVASATSYIRIKTYPENGIPAVGDISDAPFTITSATPYNLALTSLNGGETLNNQASATITFTTNLPATNSITFYYSLDGGNSWIYIGLNKVSILNGSYTWTVPNNISSTQAKIKAESTTPFVDISNAPFTISTSTPGSFTLVSPNGGESWPAGSTQSITWTSKNISDPIVELFYSIDGGTSWSMVSDGIPNNGTYTWTVPDMASSTIKFRVQSQYPGIFKDESDANFSVVPGTPVITLTALNGGENLVVGTTTNIYWTSFNINSVKVEYSNNGGTTWNLISAGIPKGTSYYAWTIPNENATTIKVRVSDSSNASVNDVSNANFSIKPPFISITAPAGNEIYTRSTNRTIAWTSNLSGNFTLDYSTDGGANWTALTTNGYLPSYSWSIPSNATLSDNYKIRISKNGTATISNIFSVKDTKYMVLNTPNGGETWTGATPQTIVWTQAGLTNVKLEYSVDGGTNWTTITTSAIGSQGYYSWSVPAINSSNVLVRASDATNAAIVDGSNAAFTVVTAKAIAVTFPNTNETFLSGSSREITWTSTAVSNVKIEYSTDGGTTFPHLIAATVPATPNSYAWPVPNITSSLVRVRVSDASDASVKDISDVNFTIQPPAPAVALLTPNGGETYTEGLVANISWTSTSIGQLVLKYSSNNGTSWTTIATVNAAPTSYNWTIPTGNPTSTYLIEASDATNAALKDQSNAVFTVKSATSIIIGNANVGQKQTSPLVRENAYGISEMILTQAEINQAGFITKIGFYKADGANLVATQNVRIYLKDTTTTTMGNGAYSLTGYTKVYEGSFPNTTASGWMEVALQNSFEFKNTKNVAVLITVSNNPTLSSPNIPTFTYSTTSTNRYRSAGSVTDNALTVYSYAHTQRPDVKLSVSPLVANDAGVVVLTAPTIPFNQGSNAVVVKIKNYGTATLTSAKIDWKINGVAQTAYNWTGSLAPGALSAAVALGNGTFAPANIVEFSTSLPNGVSDLNSFNDQLILNNLYPRLSGALTIGGASPNFPTFTAAIEALKTYEVGGAVTFNVRTGTYTEQLIIPQLTGTSVSNTVTFQSETDDSTAVNLSAVNVTNTPILRFDGADYVTFRKMTIQSNGGSNNSKVIELVNGANGNKLLNNRLIGLQGSYSFLTEIIIHSDNTNTIADSANVIRQNFISGGSYGVYFNGPAAPKYERDNVVEGNLFRNQYIAAVYANNQRSFLVKGNDITTTSNAGSYRAIHTLGFQQGLYIAQNRMYNVYEGIIMNGTAALGFEQMVANNFVHLKFSPGAGINTSGASYIKLYYNTLVAGSNGILSLTSTTNIDIKNNIFHNNNASQIVYLSGVTNWTSNNNAYYTSGTRLGFYNGEQATLAAWKTATGQDANSIFIQPIYKSASDFHLSLSFVNVNGKGTAIAGLTTDIDGETRANPSDIGADEYIPYVNNSGIVQITGPVQPFNGTQAVVVTLKNFGSANLTQAKVNWSVNGAVQPVYNWTGTALPGDSLKAINIGTYNFGGVGSFVVKAWTSLPNNATDADLLNDTTTVTTYTALAGTYTIGGTAPNYSTITEAVNSLKDNGISGPVVFNIRNGIYNERIQLTPFLGSSTTNTVTFQAESNDSTAVILHYAGTHTGDLDNLVLGILGADNLVFKRMTIKRTDASTFYTRAIYLRDGAENIEFNGCILEVNSTQIQYEESAVVQSIGTSVLDKNLRFVNNRIKGGRRGIYLEGGTTPYASSAQEQGLLIKNNIFEAQSTGGTNTAVIGASIELRGFDAPVIEGNNLGKRGIFLKGIRNKFRVTNNWGTDMGGYYSYWNGFYYTTKNAAGVSMEDCNSTVGNNALVANNAFPMLESGANGFYLDNSSNIDLYYNSVNTAKTGSYTGVYMSTTVSNITLKNNILTNNGTGGNVVTAYSTTNITFANNNYHSASGRFLKDGANTIEASSINMKPLFVSFNDLHIANNLPMTDKGTPIAGTTTDLSGAIRHATTPDLGAYEYNLIGNDAGVTSFNGPLGIFSTGPQNVLVKITNFGATALTSAQINWSVNNSMQTPFAWTGSVAWQDTSAVINAGTYNFEPGVSYTLKFWAKLPNGAGDPVNGNDSIQVANKWAALSGTYTLGGTNPTFTSFNHALKTMKNGTITGPVTFSVRNGTYNEQVKISPIPGGSAINQVTFQSESGDSSLVNLEYAATLATANYVIRLDSSDYVTFKKMTVNAKGATYAHAMELAGGAMKNTFLNNVFKGKASATNSNDYSLVYSFSSSADTANIFKSNRFVDGSHGILMDAQNVAPYYRNTVVEGNTFVNQSERALMLNYLDSWKITGNNITTNTTSSSYTGIWVQYGSGNHKIIGNKITGLTKGYGIQLSNVNSLAGKETVVANNFIHAAGSADGGLYLISSNYVNVYFNNIHLTSTNNGAYALRMSAGNTVSLLNNNFVNGTNGYAAYISGTPTNWISNYNNLFTKGTNLAYYANTNRTTLAAWKTATSKDANSISIEPAYLSASDLHINRNTSGLNGTGIAVAGLITDIDGETRNATPDIGADEYSPYTDNASAVQITEPGILTPNGTNPIIVTIKNSGLNALTSAKIHWKINGGTVTDYNWAGTVASGDSAKAVQVGTASFTVPGLAYIIKVWTTLPNGMPDSYAADDTVTVIRYASLNGTYTIGGSSPDFAAFASAVNTLNQGGVSGPVTFNVRSGNYIEPVILNQVIGASATNRITFQSEANDSTQVVLSQPASANNNVIKLNGADFITFRKLTIQKTADNGWFYGIAIDLTAGANNNVFSSNVMKTIITTYTSLPQYHVIIHSDPSFAATADTANAFINNYMEGGFYGFYFGGVSAQKEGGTVIKNNVLKDQRDVAIYATNQKGLLVENNAITTTSTNTSYVGIQATSVTEGTRLVKNRISGQLGGKGISLNVTGLLGKEALVANNFVQVGGITTNSIGLYISNSSYANIYHNSVWVNSTSVTSYVYYNEGSNFVNIRNNIFAHTGGGLATYFSSVPSTWVMDNNDLFTSGTNLGYYNSANRTTLAAWKTATGKDANSISINPNFISNSNLTPAETAVKEKGVPIAGVLEDINGQVRDAAKPDMGAVELQDNQNDAGVLAVVLPTVPFAAGSQSIGATIKNYGAAALTSATIQWKVNNVTQTPISWTGNVATGITTSVALGSLSFAIDSAYVVTAWTSTINGGSDPVAANDTAKVANVYAGLSGTYTIGATGAHFKTMTRAITNLNLGGVVNAVTFNIKNGTYNELLVMNTIPGASPVKNVTFQSESGDSTQVTLTSPFSATDKFVLKLNGTTHVVLKKLTLAKSVQNYSRLVQLENNAKNIQFVNNVFSGPLYTNNSGDRELIYSVPASRDSAIVIMNNKFTGGSVAISLSASSSPAYSQPGTVIQNNTFTNQHSGGITLAYHAAPQLISNTFTTTSTATFMGISLSYATGKTMVSKNRLVGGLYLSAVTGTAGSEATIANNFIQLGGTTDLKAVEIASSSYVNVYHNTVNVTNTGAGSTAVYGPYASANIKIQNNCFVNTGGGYIYTNFTLANVPVSNYNNLYQTGAFLAPSYANLAAWKTYSSKEATSIAVAPGFTSVTDLHASAIAMNNVGIPVASITEDIDGQVRNATTPDIGADEFAPPAENTGVVMINSPKVPFLHGNNDVKVTIKNFGTDALTSTTIYWSVNNVVQTPFNWAGNLSTSDSAKAISIGTYNFALKTAYSLKAWTILPNGKPDVSPGNDTLKVDNLYTALNGMYTLGGPSPDFLNFGEAVTQLNKGGVTGAVTVNVRNGQYSEQPYFTAALGASAANRITFQSESGDSTAVRLYSSVSDSRYNYALVLWGANYFTFRQMTLEATGAYGRVVHSGGNASSNIFEGNLIKGKLITTATADHDLVLSYDSTNVFRNNRFVNGNLGLNLGVYANTRGILVENNLFENQFTGAIYLNQPEAPVVRGNTFTSSTAKPDYKAIEAYFTTKGLVIQNNRIAAFADGYGIYFNSAKGTMASPVKVFNNFIQVGKTAAASGIYFTGSYNNNTDQVEVYYNSINLTSTQTTGSAALNIQLGANIKLVNNILANTGGGYAVYVLNGTGLASSNYNNLYTTGTKLAYYSTDKMKLADWRTATNFDLNSKSVNPLYVSNTDLHSTQPVIDGVGLKLANYTDDIDGQVRNTSTPDIGADEFTPVIVKDVCVDSLYKITATCAFSANEAVTIRVKNIGNYPFNVGDKIAVAYLVDNGTEVKETVTLANSLNSLETVTYTFAANADLSKSPFHVLKAFTQWTSDEVTKNDTTTLILQSSNRPTASFSFTDKGGRTIDFKPDNQGYSSYNWNFGDGTNSTQVTPTHVFTLAGVYTVELTVTDGSTCTAKSYNIVNLTPGSIVVTAPNSALNWQIASIQPITWSASGVVEVKIEYSVDNGTTWSVIAASTAAAVGSYNWKVPDAASTQALVRISDVSTPTLNDISNAAFTISTTPTKAITLAAPNGGENWLVGQSKTITWASSHIALVKIEYTGDNGATWMHLADETGSTGSYTWTPTAVSTEAKVRVSDATNAALFDESNAVFTVKAATTPVVELTKPNGDENWIVNQSNAITWTSANVTNVKLEYSTDNGKTWNAIASVSAASGTYAWTPSFTSDFVKVRLSDVLNATTMDESNDFFHINPIPSSSVALTAPTGGEKWTIDNAYAITWTSTNVADIQLEYSVNNGASWNLINQTKAAAGTYQWTPNFTAAAVLMKVSDVANGSVSSTSNAFSVGLPTPTLTITSPKGGETWEKDANYSITWTSSYIDKVKLEYTVDNGATWSVITSTTAAPVGTYLWTPSIAAAATMVRISDISDATVMSTSSAFAIQSASLTLTSPNGGESWRVSSNQIISWNKALVDSVHLDYSVDNGSQWLSIVSNLPAATGSYQWTVPANVSTTVKVRITDAQHALTQDVSDGVFAIRNNVGYSITGTITQPGGALVTDAKVVLLRIDSTNMTFNVYKTKVLKQSDQLNTYLFDSLQPSVYMVFVKPTAPLYPQALNTYVGDVTTWSKATQINLNADLTHNVVIVQKPAKGTGNASISGLVLEGTAGSGGISNGKNSALGDPLKNVPVILIDKATGEIVAYGTTDATGEFNLEGLSPGSYSLVIDYPGASMDVTTSTFNITDPNAQVELTAVVNEKITIEVHTITSIEELETSRIEMYPNPVTDKLFVQFTTNKAASMQFDIRDVNGKTVFTTAEYELNKGANRIGINLKNVSNGVYILAIHPDVKAKNTSFHTIGKIIVVK